MQKVPLTEAYGTIDFTDIIPTIEDTKKIADYKQAFDHATHSQECLNRKPFEKVACPYCDKNFTKTPQGIGQNVGARGKKASMQTAIKYYLIACILNWEALQEQLKYTLQKSYKVTKEDMTQILATWQPLLNKVCKEAESIIFAQNNLKKESLLHQKVVEALDITTPYMLRNDGVLLKCGSIHPYIKMYFKDDFETNYNKLISHPEFLSWFYKNTLLEETRQLIAELIYRMPTNEAIVNVIGELKIEKPTDSDKSTETIFTQLNNITNQEFCRVRTSNFKYKYGGDNGEIYFRISSKNFNQFDLIQMTVNEFKNQIKFVTIMKDYTVFGEQFEQLEDNGHVFNKMPIDEFLMLPGNPVVEELEIDEDIEKHEELNPKLFEDNKLKPEVQEHFMRIANEFIEGLREDNIPIEVKDIQFVGSNASYNYTKDSDIDLHIIADMTGLDDSDTYTALYNAYKSIQNNKYEVTTYGIPTEVYVETDAASNVSNGCYSVLNNKWVKEPIHANIPEFNQEEFDNAFAEWKERYNNIVNSVGSLKEEIHTPEIDEIDKLIQDIYDLRKVGLASEGEYGQGNLIFKEFRNRGYLDKLKDLKAELIGKELSLESLQTAENLTEDIITMDIVKQIEENPNLCKAFIENLPGDTINIELYEAENGHNYSLEYIQQLAKESPKSCGKLLYSIIVFKQFGTKTREPYTKPITDDGIYELRSKEGTNIDRCFYFYVIDNKAIITNGFTKKTNKTPTAEISKAQELRKEYYTRQVKEINQI